jgi:hypothetical protein
MASGARFWAVTTGALRSRCRCQVKTEKARCLREVGEPHSLRGYLRIRSKVCRSLGSHPGWEIRGSSREAASSRHWPAAPRRWAGTSPLGLGFHVLCRGQRFSHRAGVYHAYRLGYNRDPSSSDGEPAPSRVLGPVLPSPGGFPKGDRFGGSMGEVSVVDGPDWVPPRRGRELRLSRCSWREAMTVGTIESRRPNEGLEVLELKVDPLATN